MNQRQKQVAVWLSLPAIGLLLLVGVLGVWGGAYVIAPIVLLIGVAVVFVMLSRRAEG